MKRIIVAAALCFTLAACSDNVAEQKKIFDEVVKIHDNVMAKEDKLMQNKMKLDTLLASKTLPVADTAAEKIVMRTYKDKLQKADNAMEFWMQNFDAEFKGKPHAEVMAYMNGQKTKVMAVDSQITVVVAESTRYLTKFKK